MKDKGIRGIVLKVELKNIQIKKVDQRNVEITVGNWNTDGISCTKIIKRRNYRI